MYQGVRNPTISGSSTQFNIGGTEAYTDVLWNNHLIGDFSSQGLPDTSHALVPTLHNFTYDVYFWGSNLGASQALEFDVNQFFGGMGFTWGHECRIGPQMNGISGTMLAQNGSPLVFRAIPRTMPGTTW